MQQEELFPRLLEQQQLRWADIVQAIILNNLSTFVAENRTLAQSQDTASS
jgi:hypothetical protein